MVSISHISKYLKGRLSASMNFCVENTASVAVENALSLAIIA